jgi:Mg-chelatase subunit ChlD
MLVSTHATGSRYCSLLLAAMLLAGSAGLVACGTDSAGTEVEADSGRGGGGTRGERPNNNDDDEDTDDDADDRTDSGENGPDGDSDDASTTPDGAISTDATPGPDASTGTDSGPVDCETLVVSLKPDASALASFMLLVDRSNSMNTDSRWSLMVGALREVTAELDGLVNFGLMLFPGSGADGGIFGDACATGDVRVATGDRTSGAISTALGTAPNGGTPTALSLYAARDALQSSNPTGLNFVLLATDGGPGCNDSLNGSSCECIPGATCGFNSDNCLDRDRTLQAVRDLFAVGIKTFVVGIPGTSGVSDLLDEMAVEGGTAIGGRHIAVTDSTGLANALRSSTGSTVPCTYEFPAVPTNPDAIVVTVDGVVVPRDNTGTNGWSLERDRFLEFYGAACSAIRDGNPHAIEASYDCEE